MSQSQIHFSQHWNREYWGHWEHWGAPGSLHREQTLQGCSFGAGAAPSSLCRGLGFGALSRGRRGGQGAQSSQLDPGEAKTQGISAWRREGCVGLLWVPQQLQVLLQLCSGAAGTGGHIPDCSLGPLLSVLNPQNSGAGIAQSLPLGIPGPLMRAVFPAAMAMEDVALPDCFGNFRFSW